MPRIAILGATGKLGDKLVGRALERGFSVNALARNPLAIKRQNEGLTIIQGDAETGAGLEALVERCHFCVCAVGSLMPMMEKAMKHLVPVLENQKRFERFVLISRLGTGESKAQSALVSGPLQSRLPVILGPVFKDINLAEQQVRASKLPWTIVRSTRLTDDAPSGKVTVVKPNEPPPHRISRSDLANEVIALLEGKEHLREELTVGSS